MTATRRQRLFRLLRSIALWFLVITLVILLYAEQTTPMPLSIPARLLLAAAITLVLNLPFVRAIGRIYLNTTPDDADLDD